MRKLPFLLSLAGILFHLSNSVTLAALQLKDGGKCGFYYQSDIPGEEACSIPTSVSGTRLGSNVVYPAINISSVQIPTEGDLKYLLGDWPEGNLPDNLSTEECKEKFLAVKDSLIDEHVGVLPKLLPPDKIDYLCESPEVGPLSSASATALTQTRIEDWYKKRSYGEILVHPEALSDESGNIIGCGLPKRVGATFPLWGPMNVANDLWRLFRSPDTDDASVFLENSTENAFVCPLRKRPKISLISNPQGKAINAQPRALAEERCANGECETIKGSEEEVCFLDESPAIVLDPRQKEELKVDLSLSVQQLSGENVTGVSFSAFQGGQDIQYGYATALVGTPDSASDGKIIKSHTDMGVYNIFLPPDTSEIGALATTEENNIPGTASLAVSIPLREDNNKAKYKALGSVEYMQRYVCQALLGPDEDPKRCGFEDLKIEAPSENPSSNFVVEKIATPTEIDNETLPMDIKFEIKVTAKYASSNVTIYNETTVTKKDGTSYRVKKDKDGNDITKWPRSGEPQINLGADEIWRTTYFITATRDEFEDSKVVDSVTVDAQSIVKDE